MRLLVVLVCVVASFVGKSIFEMNTFQQLYNPEDPFWNIYLQFIISDLEAECSPSLETVVQWFRRYPGFEGFPGETDKELIELKNVTAQVIKEISIEHGVEFLQSTIVDAVHYAGSERLKEGQAHTLAAAFMAEFDSPLVFCNWSRGNEPYLWQGGYGNVTDPEFGYTMEFFLCCIDRKRIGFVFSLNNE
ncbi:MAG: hypothetical protein ACYC67_08615 [Prosthecobacter sp.]|jgi:hypothetical protein